MAIWVIGRRSSIVGASPMAVNSASTGRPVRIMKSRPLRPTVTSDTGTPASSRM